jgi:hypothetical protein
MVLSNNVVAGPVTSVTHFGKGAWNQNDWSSIRLVEQREARTFIQRDTSIGNNSFSEAEISDGVDNILLVTDTKKAAATAEFVFSIGDEAGAAPGFILAPRIENDVLINCIAIFVASKRMVVWNISADTTTRKTNYEFLVQLDHLSAPGAKHTLKFSYDEDGNVTIALDQLDSLSFRFRDRQMNSLVGIWGCHGTCDFYEMSTR